MTSPVRGGSCSPSLTLQVGQGMPAPHLQPLGLASLHGRSEWFSHTHSTPWQVGQGLFMACDRTPAMGDGLELLLP